MVVELVNKIKSIIIKRYRILNYLKKGIVRSGYDWRTGWDVLEQQLNVYAKQKEKSCLSKK